jgi:hypothetical protein
MFAAAAWRRLTRRGKERDLKRRGSSRKHPPRSWHSGAYRRTAIPRLSIAAPNNSTSLAQLASCCLDNV